jgi:arylsulfatase
MFQTRFPKDLGSAVLLLTGLCLCVPANAQPDKPNILIIWGDDVGMWNISAYHRGMMGGTTPNIDRIANDDTIVMFSTDNGAASNSWPDGGNQPFHGEKGVGGWEGGFRVPMLVRWPGKIPAGTTTGEFMTMEDWLPTLMSWVGEKNIKDELLAGKTIGGRSYKVHLDGYDQSDLLLNQGKSKRKEFYYFTETEFHGLRYGDWKLLFVDQEKRFRSPQLSLSTPIITNLKLDPFERFHEARGYDEWAENRSWILGQVGPKMAAFVQSFQEFPPSQKSMSIQLDDVSTLINSQSIGR